MSRPRVFVCDDEMLIRLWFGEHLKEEGYQAECFEDGCSRGARFGLAAGMHLQ